MFVRLPDDVMTGNGTESVAGAGDHVQRREPLA